MGGRRVTEDTRSNKYSYVRVDRPGNDKVRGVGGNEAKFNRAWATAVAMSSERHSKFFKGEALRKE